MENEGYRRVIPRDFFNEAKLLNCLGKLSVAILNGEIQATEELEEETSGFLVEQSIDGNLRLINYYIYVGLRDEFYYPFIPHYQKDARYPLYIEGEGERILVLTEDGKITPEFKKFCTP